MGKVQTIEQIEQSPCFIRWGKLEKNLMTAEQRELERHHRMQDSSTS